jgi:2',3'-cyclic-nucleotide 2'-phosphodiesterase (5'-nucleotidase family)
MKKFLSLIVILFVSPALAGEVRLGFLQFNDMYELASKDGRGGFAALKTLLDRERERLPGAVTVLSGDFISPSLMSGVTHGAHMIDLGNAVGIDLAVPGNHEFDFGADAFRERLKESRFPWLVANIHESDGGIFAGLAPTAIREMGGLKVGFFGVITPRTAKLATATKGLTFTDHLPAARKSVADLKAQGAEVIVALTHLDFDDDRDLARRVPGIHLILGGHDHEAITWQEGDTLIHKSGQDAYWLGVVELAVDRGADGRPLVTPSWRMLSTRGVPGDAAVAAKVADYEARLGAALDQPVGNCRQALDSRASVVRRRESSFGNLVTDALRVRLGADVALFNGGGIRGDTLRPAMEQLSRRDLMRELPFGNLGAMVEAKGSALRTALEKGLSGIEKGHGGFLQVSGLTMTIDPARPAGRRLLEATVAGQPLDDARAYRIAMPDYLAYGGDGQNVFAEATVLVDRSGALPVASLLEEYLKAGAPVDLGPGPRIKEVSVP